MQKNMEFKREKKRMCCLFFFWWGCSSFPGEANSRVYMLHMDCYQCVCPLLQTLISLIWHQLKSHRKNISRNEWTALPSVKTTGEQRCGWALYEWAERQVYITSYSPRGDANRTYSTIAIQYFSLHVWLCSWDYCTSSIVATTLKIALHRWINHRVCHEITGSVASCAVCRAYMHMLHK